MLASFIKYLYYSRHWVGCLHIHPFSPFYDPEAQVIIITPTLQTGNRLGEAKQ